jgi:hypothetical protein
MSKKAIQSLKQKRELARAKFVELEHDPVALEAYVSEAARLAGEHQLARVSRVVKRLSAPRGNPTLVANRLELWLKIGEALVAKRGAAS